MAVTLSRLAIVLTASAQGLSAEINRALRQAHVQMRRGAGALGTTMAAGLTAASGTLTVALKKGVAEIDALSARAQKLGTSTGGLAALEHAAVMADTSFEGLTTGIEKLQANLALAAGGGATKVSAALNALALDANTLRAMAPEKQLAAIAEAFGKIQDRGAQIALSKVLFGKGGAELLNTLDLGAQGLEEMTRQARILGLTIDEEGAAAVGRLDNSVNILKATWSGFSRQFAAQMAPAVQRIGDEVLRMVASFGGMEEIVSRLVGGLQAVHRFVIDAAHGFGLVVQGGRVFVAEMEVGARNAHAGWLLFLDAVKENLAAILRDAARGIAVIESHWINLKSAMISGLRSAFTELGNQAVAVIERAMNALIAGWNRVKSAWGGSPTAPVTFDRMPALAPAELPAGGGQISAALFGAADALEQAKSGYADVFSEITRSTAELEKQHAILGSMSHELVTEGPWSAQLRSQHTAATAAIQSAADEAQRSLMDTAGLAANSAGKAGGEFSRRMRQSGEEVESVFADVQRANQDLVSDLISSWAAGTGRLSSIISSWAQGVIRQLVQVTLFGRQVTLPGGGSQSFGGLLSSLGGGGGFGGFLGNLVSGLFGGFRAGGGPVSAGSSYIVGERGPEIFRAHSSGTILPGRAAMAVGGGGPVIMAPVTQIFSTGVTRAELAPVLDTLEQRAQAGVMAAYEQGGAYRRRLRA